MKTTVAMILIIILLGVIGLFFSGCSLDVIETEGENPYTRDNVESFCSSIGFGNRVDDDEYIAAQYIYSSEDLVDRYGKDFEITDISGNADLEKVLNVFKGTSECHVTIKDDIWIVKLSKDYSTKWSVVDFYESNS